MSSYKKSLDNFIHELRKFNNISQKKNVFPIMDKIRKESFNSPYVYSSMGEDSAAVFLNNQDDEFMVLITTDGIEEKFCKSRPWSAGFSAILVGVDDIFACGGEILAASSIISGPNEEIRSELLEGLLEASKRFKVPLVRGHTSKTDQYIGVSATVIGKIKKKDYISAGGASVDDSIFIIADFSGKLGRTNKFHWDTVTFKSSKEVLHKRKVMNILAANHLVNASKDISNGGIFGTLLLLLQYSQKGAIIDLELIKIPEKLVKKEYTVFDFSKMFLTTAFLLTAEDNAMEKISEICSKYRMTCFKIGIVTEDQKISVKYKGELAELFNIDELISK